MYDDILGEKEDKNTSSKNRDPINWDFSKYLNKPYCYSCGSTDIRKISDLLRKNKLKKLMRCNSCNNEWFEIWDKDINLKLAELTILR